MRPLAGTRCVITGAGRGIGRSTALALAQAGAHLTVIGRDNDSSRSVLGSLRQIGGRHDLVVADLADLDEVRRAAATIARDPIATLILNAGVAGPGRRTAAGFERSFGINHLAHFCLALGVVDALSGGRLVVVSSNAHFEVKRFDLATVPRMRGLTGFEAYRRSKLANVLFVREAARRWPEVTSVAVHPGVVASDIWNPIPQPLRWFMTRRMASPDEGGRHVVAATAGEAVSGRYYDKGRPRRPSELGCDDELAEQLWDASCRWVSA